MQKTKDLLQDYTPGDTHQAAHTMMVHAFNLSI